MLCIWNWRKINDKSKEIYVITGKYFEENNFKK